ncbi:hypothetical protein RSOLAG22IIIB_07725 [Rhizoctonia solani]|uniref:F-box domain-containing protein n=1 Tax=Rhizoctonia solani TaxID=456999 RepID=A0A0K6FP94_9AGAM|nr:hypothetical protein RSOLAG22IIIB_07725 [Rhizoctonia solani]
MATFPREFTVMMREAISDLTLVEFNDVDKGDVSESLVGTVAESVTEDDISEPAPHKRLRTDEGGVKFATDNAIYAQKTITSMPPEILHAIAFYLTPPDLLALTRSTKLLRGTFMSRSSQHIWISAIANVHQLPPCPTGLAEPQYISLMYSKTCSECGSHTHRPMDACLRVRLCGRCRNLLIRGVDLTHPILILLPYELYSQPEHSGISYILKRDLDEIREILEDPQFEEDKAFLDWHPTRLREMEERFKHADGLEVFLQDMERERTRKQKEERKLNISPGRLVHAHELIALATVQRIWPMYGPSLGT